MEGVQKYTSQEGVCWWHMHGQCTFSAATHGYRQHMEAFLLFKLAFNTLLPNCPPPSMLQGSCQGSLRQLMVSFDSPPGLCCRAGASTPRGSAVCPLRKPPALGLEFCISVTFWAPEMCPLCLRSPYWFQFQTQRYPQNSHYCLQQFSP